MTAWITHLLATGTGRQGRGLLAFEPPGSPGEMPDAHTVAINPEEARSQADSSVWAPLGAQFLLWEYATAVAGWLMGLNPFEPAGAVMREAEDDAVTMLRTAGQGPLPGEEPAYVDGDIEIHADFVWPGGPGGAAARPDLPMTLEALLAGVPWDGYLSVSTFLSGDFSGRYLAPALARASGRPVTYGTGPGHLHATGPVHKDGPGTGAFLIVSGDPPAGDTLAAQPIPGRPYSLARMRLARAIAEVRALRRRGLPVVRLHLRDPVAGAERLIEAARTAGA
jgi:glucose-6-phosphate isomerase